MRNFERQNNLYQARSKLEWWYVHGTFESESKDVFSFMISVFRHNLDPDNQPESAYSLISSVYNHKTNQNTVISTIDPRFLNDFIESSAKELTSNVHRQILEVYIEEYKKYGPQKPIELSSHSPQIYNSPFKFNWENVQLVEEGNDLSVILNHPEQHIDFRFRLSPEQPEIQMPVVFHSSESASGMEYNFFPRMKLTGFWGQEPVTGVAWMDHQWGDLSWLKKGQQNMIVLGWNWYGFNFDNGTDLMVMVHRNPESGDELYKYGMYMGLDTSTELISEINLNPIVFWQSPSTLINYPVEMRLKIPELDAELTFKPFSPDQEIPFMGPMRTVWQGAGEVIGIINGNPVRGRARCELNGYGYIFDFKNYINSLGKHIDKMVEGFLPKKITDKTLESYIGVPVWKYESEAYNKILADPVWDLISRNGKRWRSLFGRYLASSLGVDPIPYEELVYSITELNHAGSLIIDDIEDNSIIRRGEDCIHIRYGNDLAINAANTLYFLPKLLVFNHPKLNTAQKYEISELINKGFIQGHFGQGLDIYWSKYLTRENLETWTQDTLDEKILQMYAFKSAAGLRGLAETAAIIAECDMETRKACCDYALALGVAFQILDDVHNFSESGDWRKTTGEDLREGKITFVIYHSIKMSTGKEKNTLMNFLSNPEQRSNPDLLKIAVAIVNQSGAIEYCRTFANKLVAPKWEKLSEFLVHSEHKIMLKSLSKWLLEFAY